MVIYAEKDLLIKTCILHKLFLSGFALLAAETCVPIEVNLEFERLSMSKDRTVLNIPNQTLDRK